MATNTPKLSIVIPVYQAAQTLTALVQRLFAVSGAIELTIEIILVNDASTDNSWVLVQELARQDARIRGIQLSRNFGQHNAITAGLDASCGEWIVVMDCDLQDQPEEISRLYAKAQEGYRAVLARRGRRHDSWLTVRMSRLFYTVLEYLTGIPQDAEVGNFGIYHRQLIDTILQMRESTRYFPTLVRWAGFPQTTVAVAHAPGARPSTYSIRKRLQLATDILLTYSDKPLRLAVYTGLCLATLAFVLGAVMLIRALLGQIVVLGYASLIVTLSFFSGVIIAVLGVVGLYVGKTFENVRRRPLYVIAETTWQQHESGNSL